jgi:hypothetical protein
MLHRRRLHLVLEALESRLCSGRCAGSHPSTHLRKKSGVWVVHEHLLRLGSVSCLHGHNVLKIRLVALTFSKEFVRSFLNLSVVFVLLPVKRVIISVGRAKPQTSQGKLRYGKCAVHVG